MGSKAFRVLGCDTSSKSGSVAVIEIEGDQRRILGEWSIDLSARHSERLLWSIHHVLDAAGLTLGDVDLIGVGLGPGSFTGLRVGVTTVKTLAWAHKKPVTGVSSLAALARPIANVVAQLEARTVVISTVDAAKSQLYALVGSAKSVLDCACWSDGDEPGLWKRGVLEGVYRPEDLLKLVRKKMKEGNPARHWVAVGEGRKLFPELWKSLGTRKEVSPPFALASRALGSSVAALAWEAYQVGLVRDPRSLKPRYVRASEAEEKLKARIRGQVS